MNKTADLAFWINERYSIKLRRDAGVPPPWTADRVMASVRFCNVHREDDKVTKWLAEHWRPRYHTTWHILLARLINNIPTLEKILPILDGPLIAVLPDLEAGLKEWRKVGPIWGNAYLVSTNGISMDKVEYVVHRVLRPAIRKPPDFVNYKGITCAGACRELISLNGVSTFMAGQIIADLKNTDGHPLRDAPDRWQWATPGPGSLKGLEAYYGAPVRSSGFAHALAQCYEEVKPFICNYVPQMHMQDFQNCMCEFSKYMRVRAGGRARNTYTARS